MCCSHGLREPYGAHEQHGRHSQRARRSLTPKADARSRQKRPYSATRASANPGRDLSDCGKPPVRQLRGSPRRPLVGRRTATDQIRRFHERGSPRRRTLPTDSETREIPRAGLAAVAPLRPALRGLGGRRRPRDGDAHSSPCKACARTRVCPASRWLWRATGRAGPTPRAKKERGGGTVPSRTEPGGWRARGWRAG